MPGDDVIAAIWEGEAKATARELDALRREVEKVAKELRHKRDGLLHGAAVYAISDGKAIALADRLDRALSGSGKESAGTQGGTK